MESDEIVRGIAVLLILFGFAVALTSWIIFPVCEMHGGFTETKTGTKLLMPCGYTARAETGMGAIIVVAGVLLMARRTRETRQAVGVITVASGILTILFPAFLIGMCKMAEHPCRQLTQPTLELLGIAVIIIGGYLFWKRDE